MASSSSSSSKSSNSPRHPPLFTPIEEGNEEEEHSQGRSSFRADTTPSEVEYMHHPTPLHFQTENKCKGFNKNRQENGEVNTGDNARGVLCNKCRPSNREKITVVPLDNKSNSKITSSHGGGIFKSVLSTLVKKSPRLSSSSEVGSSAGGSTREEQWKIAVAELSHKLIQATRKRDEAILEASRLKFSMVELEKKLNKLEIYCHNLKSGLEVCSNNVMNKSPLPLNLQRVQFGEEDKVIEHFLVMVSEARSSVRILSRSMTLQLRQIGGKVYDRIAVLLQPYDIKISISRNPRGLLVSLESLLNRAFYEDFESIRFQKSCCNQILNPIDRCESNFGLFNRLKDLTWEEVLSKGTRFYCEEFSKFCDRKMSEIVAMLEWNRAWPEPLLQSFFGASKAVWLVHLLANSLHPTLPIFRVDKDMKFDCVYMEDMGGDKAKKLVPAMVRIMVTPGFYVYDNVVKCKVLCRYNNNSSIIHNIVINNNEGNDLKGLTPLPT